MYIYFIYIFCICHYVISIRNIPKRLIDNLVLNDQILAIAAENSFIDTVWFMYVININCIDHSSNNIGTCLFIPSETLTFLVTFTSSDVSVLQRLSKVRVMSVD